LSPASHFNDGGGNGGGQGEGGGGDGDGGAPRQRGDVVVQGHGDGVARGHDDGAPPEHGDGGHDVTCHEQYEHVLLHALPGGASGQHGPV